MGLDVIMNIENEIAGNFGKLREFFNEMQIIVDRGYTINDRERGIVIAVTNVTVQKMIFDIALEEMYLVSK